jgi:glycine/D-amino acid oxidase-like deaminating enzyme
MPKVAVIGGGIAGCTTALELAKQGHKVIIYEQNSDILQGTSSRTPGRMGLGYHYFHSGTAEHYMRQTVGFMQKYSDCFVGNELTPHLQHGRYFIVKDSLIDSQELMANYDDVERKFEEICKTDPSKSIFGTMHLHRTLHRSEFESDIASEKVAFAFETEERLLDWQKFSARLKSEIANNPNIEIRKGRAVEDISIDNSGKFLVKQSDKVREVDYVVNCTWQNIEDLNAKLDIGDAHIRKTDPTTATTSRLKLLVEVELPDSLKDKHSMFFCVGPHAMFSNLGNGKGRITFAPVTNFGTTTETKMPEQWERWLSEGLSPEETQQYGQAIIDGVTGYIPAMKDAVLSSVIAGIVKSKGSVDIADKDSPFHKRDYSGVEEQRVGWIDNAAMKLFYCLGNAEEVAEIIRKQELAKTEIRDVIDFISLETLMVSDQNVVIKQSIPTEFFTRHLQTNFKSPDLEGVNARKLEVDLKDRVEKKGLMIREITQLAPTIQQKHGVSK